MEAALEFLGFKVENVDYNLIDFENFKASSSHAVLNKLEGDRVNIDVSAKVINNSSEDFSEIEVSVSTTDKLNGEIRRVHFSIRGAFNVNAPEASEAERESLLKINGTAILLPYCRNYLSNLTGFDTTYSQLLMPPFNVTTLFNDEDNNDS